MTRQKDVEAVDKSTGNGPASTEAGYSPFTQNALIFTAAALGSTLTGGSLDTCGIDFPPTVQTCGLQPSRIL